MSNAKFTDLSPDVLPHLDADPSQPVLERAAKRAVVEFCDLSSVWRYRPDPQGVTAGEVEYDVEAPPGAEVSAVLSVKVNGQKIEARSIETLDNTTPDWSSTRAPVRYFTQLDPSVVILAPVPNESKANSLEMLLALRPALTSSYFPKWIMDRFGDYLAYGTMARLMLMQNKAWTSPQLGAYYQDKFTTGIAVAKRDGDTAMGTSVIRTTPHY